MPSTSPHPSLVVVDANERYVVIDKPAGLLSVPGKGEANQDCASERVRLAFPGASGPLVVHRLDMDTSGLLVFGLDPDAQRELSAQFESRDVEKAYTALVAGLMGAESGVIDLPIRPDYTNRPYQVVDHVEGRPSVTGWRVLALETDRTRVELTPLTGRTHQLRVHCAAVGHPILGDPLYGPQPSTAASGERLMLHASALAFRAPGSPTRVVYTSVAPF